MATLQELAASLGSDVPFFLYGGTALGLGRGEELYPLPAAAAPHALLVSPGIHVSTPAAFRALAREPLAELTAIDLANRMKRFQSLGWGLACARSHSRDWEVFCENDFEAAVFPQHPSIQSLHRQLGQLGASPARMSGSGSALFGVFRSRALRDKAAKALTGGSPEVRVHSIRFISRDQYRAAWRRALGVYLTEATAWPPK
jgi:4-diphosphocytidyl-2-C-methyl-D-erythritol kinase